VPLEILFVHCGEQWLVRISDGKSYENKDISVSDDKMLSIGRMDNIDIDLSGLLVLPGFIDIHIHGSLWRKNNGFA